MKTQKRIGAVSPAPVLFLSFHGVEGQRPRTVQLSACDSWYGGIYCLDCRNFLCYNEKKGAIIVSKKVRCTNHRSRRGTNGKPINSIHNEHNFVAEHIDPALTSTNIHYFLANEDGGKIVQGQLEKGTIDRYEQQFYEDYFAEALERRNAKAIIGKKPDRVQTMEQYRHNAKACVEECILEIGTRNDKIPPAVLNECFREYVQWHWEQYPNVVLLDASMHTDEPNAGAHIHLRQVWVVEAEENGKTWLEISQKKALEAMGFERPDLTAKAGQRNNAKMTFTAETREKWLDIVEQHGISVERKPREKSKSGRKLDELKAETLKEEIAAAEVRLQELNTAADKMNDMLDAMVDEQEEYQEAIAAKRNELNDLNDEIAQKVQEIEDLVSRKKEYAKVIQKYESNRER